jgi:hypothetical protein
MRLSLLFAPFHLANFYKYLIFTFTCMVKYLVGIIYAKADGLNFYETAAFGALGGILGVVFFAYFGAALRKYYLAHRRAKKKPINFRRAKRIRSFWNQYGLIGLSVICPFISPMLAVFIALAFREEPRRIIPFMSISVLIWSILLAFALNFGTVLG